MQVTRATVATFWTVVVRALMVPEIHTVSALSATFDCFAPDYGSPYDGWGTGDIEK